MSSPMWEMLKQTFPGHAKFTENNIPDLSGKVIIVTGSNTGVGKDVAQAVYAKNARVYMMTRSEEKTNKAISEIEAAHPASKGELIYIPLDLADLASIKTSAEHFLRREQKLDILFNNAGVAFPGVGSKTKQGYELQLGVNCLGSFALTKHLTPILVSTAKASPPASVRVVWTSSSAAYATKPGDFMKSILNIEKQSNANQYFISKLGNYLHATEFATRHKQDGVLSISLNPGNLDSDLWRTQGPVMHWVLRKLVLHPTRFGAYTTMFAGLAPEIKMENSGQFVAPWGHLVQATNEMRAACKTKVEGGTEVSRDFWSWSEKQIKQFV